VYRPIETVFFFLSQSKYLAISQLDGRCSLSQSNCSDLFLERTIILATMDHNDDEADTDQAKAEAATAAPAAPHIHEGWINVPCSCAWCGAIGRAAPSTGHEDDDGGGGDGSVVDADTATQ
jgi:hypothetical protein